MITGDENIVYADLVVQYKIADPVKYLFNAEKPREILCDEQVHLFGVLLEVLKSMML